MFKELKSRFEGTPNKTAEEIEKEENQRKIKEEEDRIKRKQNKTINDKRFSNLTFGPRPPPDKGSSNKHSSDSNNDPNPNNSQTETSNKPPSYNYARMGSEIIIAASRLDRSNASEATVTFYLVLKDNKLYISEFNVSEINPNSIIPEDCIEFDKNRIGRPSDTENTVIAHLITQLSRLIGSDTQHKLFEYMKKYPTEVVDDRYVKLNTKRKVLSSNMPPEIVNNIIITDMKNAKFTEEEIDNYISGNVPSIENYSGEALEITYKIYLHTVNKRLCVSVYSILTVEIQNTKLYLVTNPISSGSINLSNEIDLTNEINKEFLNGVSQLYVRGGRRKTKRRTNRQYKPKTKNKKQTKRKRTKRRLY